MERQGGGFFLRQMVDDEGKRRGKLEPLTTCIHISDAASLVP